MNMESVLVTLRVDALDYDETNDRYTITLNDCALTLMDAEDEDNKETELIKFEINDRSKVVHVDRNSKFIANQAIKLSEDDQKMAEQDILNKSHVKAANDGILTVRDKWFLIFWALYIIAAVLVFVVIEGDTFVSAFYFRIVTSFGVGYGDFYPQTPMGKLLNCLFIVIDLAKLAYIDWRILSLLFKYRQQKFAFEDMYASTPHPRFDRSSNLEESMFAKIINHRNLLIYISLLLSLFFVSGTLVMCLHEGHGWLEGLEWNFVTLSQVGYGNTVPRTPTGQIFSIFYIILGYVLLLSLAVIIFDKFMLKMMQQDTQKSINDRNKIESVGLLSQ
eukprot:1049287_1